MPAQEKIRVLIVDDISETRENIQRLLQFDRDIEVVGNARSGSEAISLSQQVQPDVVLMDINMPDMDGITATEEIRRRVPFTQIVILSVQGDPNYMRKAMLAGARDFLTKPPSIDDLTNAIHRAGEMAKGERARGAVSFTGQISGTAKPGTSGSSVQGSIIVVYSPTGGTGCTTITTNLALDLQKENNKVVLVDGDLQFGDVCVFLNEQAKNSIFDLTKRADELEPEIVKEVATQHSRSAINIISAPPRPEIAEAISGDQFAKTLKFLSQLYDYVVVDTSSYLTDVVQAAIESADIIILTLTQSIPSIKNANLFLTLMDASGIERSHIVMILNKYDKRIAISPERVGESLRQEVVVAIPWEEKSIDQSINRGVPFILDNKNHPVGKAITQLTNKVQDKLNENEKQRLDSLGI